MSRRGGRCEGASPRTPVCRFGLLSFGCGHALRVVAQTRYDDAASHARRKTRRERTVARGAPGCRHLFVRVAVHLQ